MQPPDLIDAGVGAVERPPPPADRLPTLTEVVLLGGDAPHGLHGVVDPQAPGSREEQTVAQAAEPETTVLDTSLSAASLLASALPGACEADAQAIAQQVLAELSPRIDALFEARLREALAPVLARAADGLIRQARDELTLVMRELVQDAVARSLRPDAKR